MQTKIQQIKGEIWRTSSSSADSATAASIPARWTHRGGHVEKVKLPEFNGDIEDYSEFKSQFQQLCAGERYSPVIKLAQLRTKLPKDGVKAIIGQTVPERAWERLD